MPVLGKHTLTRFLGSDCQKQLRILLAPDTRANPERQQQGMPPKQPPLPGLNAIAEAGDQWAATRLAELRDLLGPEVLVGTVKSRTRTTGIEFDPTPLAGSLSAARPGTFLAEHEYAVSPAFHTAFHATPLMAEYGLTFADLRPDLIEVRAAGTCQHVINPDGSVLDVAPGDTRRQLRVIDIKLTAQPGPGYFAEVVYYSAALAGWLEDNNLAQHFAVCSDPAIWPGSHEASALVTAQRQARAEGLDLTRAQALNAVAIDLEVAPLAVFVSRLQHFFTTTLPEVLSQQWQDLPFHVTSRCRGCDFLGQDWGTNSGVDPLHCLPTAKATGHLSQIAFVSRGASQLLAKHGNPTVEAVAALTPGDPAFDDHHSLRSQRTIITSRAASLSTGTLQGVAPDSGTSAMLPSWSALNIYVTADFDASSAITLALGVTGYWREPTALGAEDAVQPRQQVWNRPKTFVVDQRDLKREEAVLLQFLDRIDEMLQYVEAADAQRGAIARDESSVQVYLWDDLTYRHLCRIVGRHLPAILAARPNLRTLAWLFPPEVILPNHRMLADPVITIVGDAVRSLVALPLPHHYSLLETARRYHSTGLAPRWSAFTMPRLWEDPLSDQIPSERAHEVWNRGPNFTQTIRSLDWAVGVRLQALEEVTKRLRQDLKGQPGGLRRRAPGRSVIAAPQKVDRLTADETLLLAFTRLNAAVEAQEAVRRRAMPAHEREARFSAARLRQRYTGDRRTTALADLGLLSHPKVSDLQVYEVRTPGSDQANFKEGDFLCALVPEQQVEVLDWNIARFVRENHPGSSTQIRALLDDMGRDQFRPMSDVLGATLVRFDRDKHLIAVEMTTFRDGDQLRRSLMASGALSLNRTISLEKITKDFLSEKLETTLKAIGRTPKAVSSPIAVRALGSRPTPHARKRVPVEDVLWDASAMADTAVARDVPAAQAALIQAGRDLNTSQWRAFAHALTHRLTLLWGPPGTGKSRTVTNIVTGAALAAEQYCAPLRVLVTSSTYGAVDNVLQDVASLAARLMPSVQVWRCRSAFTEAALAPVIDCQVSARQPDDQQRDLMNRLSEPVFSVTIVGATPQQTNNLAAACDGPTTSLFDLIVIDEASQVDVANAVLPLALLAEGGSVVVAGDPLQLPPIHQVDPPEGAEHLVGSIYDFLGKQHHVPAQELLINYRSNAEIVDLARDADYPTGLVAHSPALRLALLSPVPSGSEPPPGWPDHLVWSPEMARLLDPSRPVTCVVYRDGLSGQSNPFEAQIVAGLAWLLHGRLAERLSGERGFTEAGVAPLLSPGAYGIEDFLRTGLGVVTPHRAQQSMISMLLAKTLPSAPPQLIRDAVDTVERFQGQQRDVIIASYAVGDPDTVAQEDEFLQSLNRFNVMASRARAKVIVLISEELLQHLPVDLEVLRASRLLKAFADIRCRHRSAVNLGYRDGGVDTLVPASLRWS